MTQDQWKSLPVGILRKHPHAALMSQASRDRDCLWGMQHLEDARGQFAEDSILLVSALCSILHHYGMQKQTHRHGLSTGSCLCMVVPAVMFSVHTQLA